jgi:exosome complex RNA-binding protein Rrp42 (RNase PH superfamily)
MVKYWNLYSNFEADNIQENGSTTSCLISKSLEKKPVLELDKLCQEHMDTLMYAAMDVYLGMYYRLYQLLVLNVS